MGGPFSNWRRCPSEYGGTTWLRCRSTKCSIPTLLWQYSRYLSSLPRIGGDHYNDRSWYWTIQESAGAWRSIRFIRRWGGHCWDGTIGVSVDGRTRSVDKEPTSILLLLSLKKLVKQQKRKAYEILRKRERLQKSEKEGRTKVADEHGKEVPCRI